MREDHKEVCNHGHRDSFAFDLNANLIKKHAHNVNVNAGHYHHLSLPYQHDNIC